MFKQAAALKLRFATPKGSLTVEQLFDLSLTDLDKVTVALKKEYEESGKQSFLTTRSVKDKEAKLRFDIALDILNSKVEEAEELKLKKDRKERNQKILAIIEEKKDESLKGKSVRALEALLEEEA